MVVGEFMTKTCWHSDEKRSAQYTIEKQSRSMAEANASDDNQGSKFGNYIPQLLARIHKDRRFKQRPRGPLGLVLTYFVYSLFVNGKQNRMLGVSTLCLLRIPSARLHPPDRNVDQDRRRGLCNCRRELHRQIACFLCCQRQPRPTITLEPF